jgi:signal transduction histidine kinase
VRRISGSWATLIALGALLILSVALSLDAIREAARADRAAARALNHIASLSAWEFAEQAASDLAMSSQITSWFARRVPDHSRLPPPDSLFELSGGLVCECPPLLLGTGYASVELRTTGREEAVFTGDGWRAGDSAALRAIAPVAVRYARPASPLVRDSTASRLVAWHDGDSAGGRLLLVRLAREESGAPQALFASLVRPDSLRALFERTRRQTRLLPASLTAGLPASALVSLTVRTPSGAILFDLPSSEPLAAHGVARDTLGEAEGRLVVEVRLSRRAAAIVGGLTPGGPDQALVMLSAAVLLIGAAAWQVRRQGQLSRARTEFIASVSHELLTPLGLITAYVETMLAGRVRDTGERRRFLDVVLRETQRLTRFVDNVLRFAASDRPERHLSRQPVRLLELAVEACHDLEPLTRSRAVRVETSGDDTVEVLGDRDALRQVLLNALDNAVKYGPPGQRIGVSVERAADGARLIIDDEGRGIPTSDRSRVLQPYVRLASALDREARAGSGIGLAVVHSIVRQHGGTVALHDAPGGGLRLLITVPLRQ